MRPLASKPLTAGIPLPRARKPIYGFQGFFSSKSARQNIVSKDVLPAEAIMPGLEDMGIHGSYLNSIQFGNNNFFGSRPGFNFYLMSPSGSYVRGFMPDALNNSVPVDAAIHYDSMRLAMAQWT